MKFKTMPDFIEAALDSREAFEILVLDDPITVLAEQLLHVFVK